MKLQKASVLIVCWFLCSDGALAGDNTAKPRGYSIPLIDLAHETHRQIVVGVSRLSCLAR